MRGEMRWDKARWNVAREVDATDALCDDLRAFDKHHSASFKSLFLRSWDSSETRSVGARQKMICITAWEKWAVLASRWMLRTRKRASRWASNTHRSKTHFCGTEGMCYIYINRRGKIEKILDARKMRNSHEIEKDVNLSSAHVFQRRFFFVLLKKVFFKKKKNLLLFLVNNAFFRRWFRFWLEIINSPKVFRFCSSSTPLGEKSQDALFFLPRNRFLGKGED